MARLSTSCVAAVALLAIAALPAWQDVGPDEIQTHSGPYAPGESAVMRVDTRLVETPVVVRDPHGRAVAGLSNPNFDIFDSGRKRPVSAFSVVNSPRAASPSAATTTVAADAASPAAALAPAEPRYVALLFDDENMGFDNLAMDGLPRAVDAGVRFVQEGLAKGDQAAVFSISQGGVSPFTTDPTKLIVAIKSLRMHRRLQPPSKATGCITPYTAYIGATRGGSRPSPPPPPAKSSDSRRPPPPRAPGGQGGGVMARAVWEEVRSNSRRLLGQLREIVDFMGKLPGTRMVLVASPGFQTGTLEPEIAGLMDHAVRAGVVINAMDMSGLFAGPSGADCSPSAIAGPIMQQAATSVLSGLADATGGRFFHNNNDLLQAFHELAAPPEVSYRLGFVPDAAPDGRLHRLRVQVTPPNHYDIQSRPSYFSPNPDDKPRERAIDKAILAADTRSDLPVRVSMVTDHVNALPAVWAVAHVDVARLPFRRVDDRRVQNLTIVAALFDDKGNFVVGKEGGIALSLTDASFAALSKDGINCTLTLLAPSASYRLRTVVMDSVGGRVVAANESVAPW